MSHIESLKLTLLILQLLCTYQVIKKEKNYLIPVQAFILGLLVAIVEE